MLKYSLNLLWDKEGMKWMVDSISFGEDPGTQDPTDVTDIHVINAAMKIVSKIIDVIDLGVTPTAIDVVPGTPVLKPVIV